MNRAEEQFRIERDPLGEARVPADALYGIQTKRALDNFRISRLRRTGRPRDSSGKKHSRIARRGSQEGRTQNQG
jgi:hypothetical protein